MTAQIIRLADYRPKPRPSAERINDALQQWQTAAHMHDPAAALRNRTAFWRAMFEDSAKAIDEK